MGLLVTAGTGSSGTTSDAVVALIGADGTGAHRYPAGRALWHGKHATANLADLVYSLCVLHGRMPGVIDHAADKLRDTPAARWAEAAAAAFPEERHFIVQLVSETGPVPSTPGQAESEAALHVQHHALEMLARSDRIGCAAGAAAALIIDWFEVRALLDRAAERLGIVAPPAALPSIKDACSAVDAFAGQGALERAILFGAQQLAIQQHAFWDLLEARQAARSAG